MIVPRCVVVWLAVVAVWGAPAVECLAGACFTPAYYEMIFQPKELTAWPEGDPRLVGESDYLAATGTDPHPTKEGDVDCVCGINNGRWDQLLRNASEADPDRVPAVFVIQGLSITPFNPQNTVMGTAFKIGPERMASCFDSPIAYKAYRAFNAPGGHSDRVEVLEPGEAVIGCLCLTATDRNKSGYAKVDVSYRRAVWSFDLGKAVSSAQGGGRTAEWKGRVSVHPLQKGQAQYYRIALPALDGAAPADLSVKLTSSRGTALYALPPDLSWAWEQAKWKKGDFTDPRPKTGQPYWFMVRSLEDGGTAALDIVYRGPSPAQPPAPSAMGIASPASGFTLVELEDVSIRSFKAFILGTGEAAGDTGPVLENKLRPCCSATP